MCGILAINSIKIDLTNFNDSLSLLTNRGPDDSAVVKINDNLIFGHRRLSIQDLSQNAAQPMISDDKRYTIVYNGEIYNFKNLRDSLGKLGYNFNSKSDTEVLLKMYSLYNIDMIESLTGDFAIGIYDSVEKEIVLIRDRYGVKPLYYYKNKNIFAFSSELKSLTNLEQVNKKRNNDAFYAFLKLGSVPEPLTLFENILMLPSGSYLKYKDNKVTIKKYYNLNFKPNNFSYQQNIEQVRALIDDSVNLRMISDLPVGAFLSGGIDSSIVVAMMRKNSNGNINTFSIDFENDNYSEGNIAKIVAERYQTNHQNFVLQSLDLSNELYNILDSIDSPTIDGVNTYFISKFTSEAGISVAMSGLGGDEIFGGYDTFENHKKLLILKKVFSILPKRIYNGLRKIKFNNRTLKLIDFLKDNYEKNLSAYFALRGLLSDSVLERLLKFPYDQSKIFNLQPDHENLHFYSNENIVSYLEISNFMKNQLLRDSDIMSMKHSLELRVPFTDHNLIDFSLTIPGKYKHGKKILIDSMKSFLPEQVYMRQKQGFSFPFEEWIRKHLLNEIKELFFMKNELFNYDELEKLWVSFLNYETNWARVWAIVVINYYNIKYFYK